MNRTVFSFISFSRFSLTCTPPPSSPPHWRAYCSYCCIRRNHISCSNCRSKKFQAARDGSASSLLISCVDGVQSNQSIIAPISAGGGSYLAVTCTNNSLTRNKEVRSTRGITISRKIKIEPSVKNFISTDVIKKSYGCNVDEVLSSNAAALKNRRGKNRVTFRSCFAPNAAYSLLLAA